MILTNLLLTILTVIFCSYLSFKIGIGYQKLKQKQAVLDLLKVFQRLTKHVLSESEKIRLLHRAGVEPENKLYH